MTWGIKYSFDDCFCAEATEQASTAVFDRDMSVRAGACRLMGSIPAVRPQYLIQVILDA